MPLRTIIRMIHTQPVNLIRCSTLTDSTFLHCTPHSTAISHTYYTAILSKASAQSSISCHPLPWCSAILPTYWSWQGYWHLTGAWPVTDTQLRMIAPLLSFLMVWISLSLSPWPAPCLSPIERNWSSHLQQRAENSLQISNWHIWRIIHITAVKYLINPLSLTPPWIRLHPKMSFAGWTQMTTITAGVKWISL